MRTLHKILLASSVIALAVAPRVASAQIDVDPPPPNVLLLVDTSGSMEYLIQANAQGKNQLPSEKVGAECKGLSAPSELNRWATLVSVLTGSIDNFSCKETQRDAASFINEYTVGGAAPYDAKYYLPWNRLTSNGCTLGPGVLPLNWWDWPNNALKWHDISDPSVSCSQPWSQQNDGILDTYRDRVRFGLMTFDPFPDAGTGITANAPNMTTGNAGIWSYYSGWNGLGLGGPAKGRPVGCATDLTYEVGARNPAAPPWEGRLIGFPPPDGKLADQQTTNDRIQMSLVAMRPFGATPIAGMFADAREYLLNDASNFPPNTTTPFGLKGDGFYAGGCRKTFIILLSDGEPNEDMRPECEGSNTCPYKKADDIALELASLPGSNKQIKTFVIGFGVSDAAELAKLGLSSCSQLDYNQHCANPPKGLKACCELTKIAKAGGTTNAFFADSLTALKGQLSTVLSGIASGATARTVPIFASGASAIGGTGSGAAPADSYRFVGKFTADPSGRLWSGDLKRQRFVCTTQNGKTSALPQAPDPQKGDDFAANVNSNDPSNKRKFFTLIPPKVGGSIYASRSIRPGIAANDGLGTYASGATPIALSDGPSFATQAANSPEAFGLTGPLVSPTCLTTLKAGSNSACVEKLVRWEVGEVNNDLLPVTRDKTACPPGGSCSELGSIYHSTPVVVGPPRDFIRDVSYTDFALLQANRPLMLYTASTDGQLRAFKVTGVDQNDPNKVDASGVNNELWSFLPPAVLPKMLSSYDQQVLLLDGSPVVADVVLERKRNQAAKWNTVLVAGGGPAGGFYYALDITDPKNPKFLWQLSTDDTGAPLFGGSTSTPAITTIVLPDTSSGTADVKEVAVAILPGGSSNLNAGACARSTNSLMKVGKYSPRKEVHCWQPGPGRSLTIVRLDNGEVIMNFRASAAEGPQNLPASRVRIVPEISSPITGVPTPYPGTTGQLSDRIYVGDADGNLWRINIPSNDLTQWSMDLAWDGYPQETVGVNGALIGEPVQTPPVISTNPLGDIVVMYATADQQLLSPNTAMDARLWSLVERRDPKTNKYTLEHNWSKQFTGGERVTGPMAIFNSVAYFSTYAPAGPGALCSFGSSKIWAIDYLTAAGRFPIPAQPGKFNDYEVADNTIVFGVAINKTPSCADKGTSADGTVYSTLPKDAGQYQLTWQIGSGSGVKNNSGVAAPDASTGIQTMDLQSPPQGTRLESWAGIID